MFFKFIIPVSSVFSIISFASDPMQEAGAGLKTAFDLASSLGILILLSPLLCGIALVIKLGFVETLIVICLSTQLQILNKVFGDNDLNQLS